MSNKAACAEEQRRVDDFLDESPWTRRLGVGRDVDMLSDNIFRFICDSTEISTPSCLFHDSRFFLYDGIKRYL